MNSKFKYTGKITLKTLCRNKVITTQYFNSGESDLFKAYALALSGKDIISYLPSYINIGSVTDDRFHSFFKNGKGVSIVRTFATDDDGNYCTRITLTLTNNMFNILEDCEVVEFKLMSGLDNSEDTKVLARVHLENEDKNTFLNAIQSTPTGTQLIIVWDLYVDNKESVN